jgi:hypothetical protein
VVEVFEALAVEVVDGVDAALDVVVVGVCVLLDEGALETWKGAKRMGGKDMMLFEYSNVKLFGYSTSNL